MIFTLFLSLASATLVAEDIAKCRTAAKDLHNAVKGLNSIREQDQAFATKKADAAEEHFGNAIDELLDGNVDKSTKELEKASEKLEQLKENLVSVADTIWDEKPRITEPEKDVYEAQLTHVQHCAQWLKEL